MKIKTKITLGVGLLFSLIVFLAVFGIYQVHYIASEAQKILEDNYITLEYSRTMLRLFERLPEDTAVWQEFESALLQQQHNITEAGEAEVTLSLTKNVEKFRENPSGSIFAHRIRRDLNEIMNINMTAIQRKSQKAMQAAKAAILLLGFSGVLCLMIAFVLLIKLPSSIASPIQEITKSIKQIAAKKYSERVHFEDHNDFGELAKSFNAMAERIEEYNNSNLAEIMMEKKRIETLINKMQDAVIGIDEDMKVIFVNEEALKILALKYNDVVGYSAKDIAMRNDLMRTLMQEMILPESGRTKPLKIYANGKESYFDKEILHISVVPTGEQHPLLIGHVIVLKNVTEYKELDVAKTQFIATVSHEFKTPIASIKMSLLLLENENIGPLNEEQKSLVESVKEDASRLLKITGELLNITQLESGNIQLSMMPTDAKSTMLYALEANKVQAEHKKIKFEVNMPDSAPMVQADSEKTAWVLVNLISNAINYSYEHSTIAVKVQEEGGKIKFIIKDNGQGIASQYKDKIFDRYFRVPGSKKEGTGLGLAISKEFIEAQGGSISVESDLGRGSIFIVALQKARLV